MAQPDSTPGVVFEVMGPPTRKRSLQDRSWRRRRVYVRTEFAVELARQQGAQPSTDVEVPFGAEAVEALSQFRLGAELDENIAHCHAIVTR